MLKLLKNPLFLIGFLFITGLMTISIIYTLIVNGEVQQIQILYDEKGEVTESSPLSPSLSPFLPFGTDELGFDMLSKVIIGAKYTLFAAITIASLRMIISIALGLSLGFCSPKLNNYINSMIDGFNFIPLSLISLYLLSPFLYSGPNGFSYSLNERILIEVIVLTALAVPVLAVLIGNETNELLKKEFIKCAKTLGGSKFYIVRKHILPILKVRFWILFGEQFKQTLIVMTHLGLFNLYFGGTEITYGSFADPPQSVTYEWSGLIGGTKNYISWAPWIPLAPIICFTLTILAITFMVEGYVRVNKNETVYVTRKKRNFKKRKYSPVK
ncbi:peptide ABC transporter permease [Bacillus sp. UMB0899]|nr:peptide ABC transporter permease [Bacillus sp. UMB0899]